MEVPSRNEDPAMTWNFCDRVTACPASTACLTCAMEPPPARSSRATSIRVTCPPRAKIQVRTLRIFDSSQVETIPPERSTWTSLRFPKSPRPEFAHTVSAVIGQPAGGIATKARRRLEPVPPDDRTQLIDRRLRDRKGKPIKGFCKNVVIHERFYCSSAIGAPVLPSGGVLLGAPL